MTVRVIIASDTDTALFASLSARIATARSAAEAIRRRIDGGKLVLPDGELSSFRMLELSLDDCASDARGIGQAINPEREDAA